MLTSRVFGTFQQFCRKVLKTRLVSIGHQLVIKWSVKKPRKFNIGQHSTQDRGALGGGLVNMDADQPMLTSRAYADQLLPPFPRDHALYADQC